MWLDKAKEITQNSRQDEYGHPLINFLRTALVWSVYWERTITPFDVAMAMDLMKTAREIHVHKEDNLVDKIGYISCIDQMAQYVESRGLAIQGDGEQFLRELTFPRMWDLLQHLDDLQRKD